VCVGSQTKVIVHDTERQGDKARILLPLIRLRESFNLQAPPSKQRKKTNEVAVHLYNLLKGGMEPINHLIT